MVARVAHIMHKSLFLFLFLFTINCNSKPIANDSGKLRAVEIKNHTEFLPKLESEPIQPVEINPEFISKIETSNYEVCISDNFSSYQRKIILGAIKDWNTKSKKIVQLDPQIKKINDDIYEEDSIYIYYSNLKRVQSKKNKDAVAITKATTLKNTYKIFIAMDYADYNINLNSKLFYQIVAHELGHAIGLEHSDRGTLMSADIDVGSQTITCKDLEQLRLIKQADISTQNLCN